MTNQLVSYLEHKTKTLYLRKDTCLEFFTFILLDTLEDTTQNTHRICSNNIH
jgi:hypothetical protein